MRELVPCLKTREDVEKEIFRLLNDLEKLIEIESYCKRPNKYMNQIEHMEIIIDGLNWLLNTEDYKKWIDDRQTYAINYLARNTLYWNGQNLDYI